nr:ParB N-terminal domain-containing protein [Legionella pneumophila]
MQTRFTYLPVTSLQAGQYQPRQDFNVTELQELAQSISSQGLIEPWW